MTSFPAKLKLEEAFSDRRIVRALFRIRLAHCRRQRDLFFFERAALMPLRNPDGDILSLFPPRQEWPKPHGRERRKANRSGRDSREHAMEIFIFKKWGKKEAPEWLKKLRTTVKRIRGRALSWTPGRRLNEFFVSFEEKNKHGTYRVLAWPSSLEDRVLTSLFAFYLRYTSDPIFHRCAIAFRSPANGPAPKHHDAIKRIESFRQRMGAKPIWVGEVDIKGFYDSIDHDTAIGCLNQLNGQLATQGTQLDQRAIDFVKTYLDVYDFQNHGRPGAAKKLNLHPEEILERIPWPQGDLESLHCGSIIGRRIGVPQGGAVSCFLANAILHFADSELIRASSNKKVCYLRYCDDIIILTDSRKSTDELLAKYTETLKQLKLPGHEIVDLSSRKYIVSGEKDKGFWEIKSRGPFCWHSDYFPWIGFVGYQIRRDGLARVRLSSWKKEATKQKKVVDKLLKYIYADQKRSRRQLMQRMRQRLRAQAVGTGMLHKRRPRSEFSWVTGFRELAKFTHSEAAVTQLRDLDRHRQQALSILEEGLKLKGRRLSNKRGRQFLGFPYSYAAYIEDSK